MSRVALFVPQHQSQGPVAGFFMALLLAICFYSGVAGASGKPNAHDAPPVFVQAVADQMLDILKSDPAVRQQNLERINSIVDEYLMPYVDFERTTRLSAGKFWRDATPEQRQRLVAAFKQTLIRTYSGALSRVDNGTKMDVLAFRGEPDAKDVVVRTNVIQATNVPPVRIDYRLEKTEQGWRIYDVNVENVWLIQNYRNQFAQEINRSGIDGLITALNSRN
jgi:phospholipid transport system substrate-binding protein